MTCVSGVQCPAFGLAGVMPVHDLCVWCDCTQAPAVDLAGVMPVRVWYDCMQRSAVGLAGIVPMYYLCVWRDCTQGPAVDLAGWRWQAQDVQMQHTSYSHHVSSALIQVLVCFLPLHSHGHRCKGNQLWDLQNNHCLQERANIGIMGMDPLQSTCSSLAVVA